MSETPGVSEVERVFLRQTCGYCHHVSYFEPLFTEPVEDMVCGTCGAAVAQALVIKGEPRALEASNKAETVEEEVTQ